MEKYPLKPLVSVVMCVFNGEEFISESIDSILNQSFSDFELIIIDDGSTDNTSSIISSYSDKRIQNVINKSNIGLTRSLNLGIKISRGKYIARNDADDISLKQRLKKQVSFLQDNENANIVFCSCAFFKDLQRIDGALLLDSNTDKLSAKMFFRNSASHSSVMMRREFMLKNNFLYSEDFTRSQDYELWHRFLLVTKLYALSEILVLVRVHSQQISNLSRSDQDEKAFRVNLMFLNSLGIKQDQFNNEIHRYFCGYPVANSFDIYIQKEWAKTLSVENSKAKIFNQRYFNYLLFRKLIKKWIDQFNVNNTRAMRKYNPILDFKSFIMYLPWFLSDTFLVIKRYYYKYFWKIK